MKILLAVETLHPGGAEMFALRLASELGKTHDVILLRLYEDAADQALIANYPQTFNLAWPAVPLDKIWRKIDRALRLAGIDFSFRDLLVKRSLKKILQEHQTEVIHSNQLKVDYLTAQVRTTQGFVITLHGDYATFGNLKDSTRSILNFSDKLHLILLKKPAVAYISDAQLEFFKSKNITVPKLTKIYNGYFGTIPKTVKPDDTSFTFGMVARGIKEKGWQITIDAFLMMQRQFPHIKLLLVGDSDYLQALKTQYSGNDRIIFAGYSAQPLEWIAKMNVGLLPSYYSSESLPTSVIEYLYCGIPVVASDAGEIRNMISTPGGLAGQTLKINQNDSDAERLSLLMKNYLTDPELYLAHQQRANKAFEKFDMQQCVKTYEQVYQAEVIKS